MDFCVFHDNCIVHSAYKALTHLQFASLSCSRQSACALLVFAQRWYIILLWVIIAFMFKFLSVSDSFTRWEKDVAQTCGLYFGMLGCAVFLRMLMLLLSCHLPCPKISLSGSPFL